MGMLRHCRCSFGTVCCGRRRQERGGPDELSTRDTLPNLDAFADLDRKETSHPSHVFPIGERWFTDWQNVAGARGLRSVEAHETVEGWAFLPVGEIIRGPSALSDTPG